MTKLLRNKELQNSKSGKKNSKCKFRNGGHIVNSLRTSLFDDPKEPN